MRDLRVSVTDRCNFRCVYCMPREVFGPGFPFLPRDELLTFKEIARVARVAAQLGVRKVRITGGEPLVRRDLDGLVALLARIPGIDDITLTTNGALLSQYARPLADAGLRRVTVSLDALDDATFRAMSDVNVGVEVVLRGIEAALQAGLAPVKVNAVVKRGLNDHAIVDLVRHFRGTGVIVRFIEYMDVGTTNGWRLDDVVTADEILARLAAEFPLEPVPPAYPGEVARRWRLRDGSGEIGIIASISRPFCSECTRLRLSPEGQLFTCLFAARGHDIRALLRGGASDDDLRSFIARLWSGRTDRYSELRSAETVGLPRIEMSYIGG